MNTGGFELWTYYMQCYYIIHQHMLFQSYLKREYKEKQLTPDISTSDNLDLKRFTKDFLVSLSIEWQRRTQ